MIRTIRPTDLVALVTFEVRALPNAARTRSALGREQQRPLPVSAILEQWLPFEGRRFTWVAAEGFSIHGLISARRRTGRSAWEVDWLIVDSVADAEEIALHLLDELSQEGGEAGAQKVFLRLPADNFLVDVARQAGFWPYVNETLYRWEPQDRPMAADSSDPLVERLRRKSKADDYSVFRLYNLTVPESVRRAQGITFSDWRETQEQSPGRRQELVVADDGRMEAWLGIARGGDAGMLDLMVDPDATGSVAALVQYGRSQLNTKRPTVCLVPSYNVALQSVLASDPEAKPVSDYTTLVKYLTVRAPALGLVPAHA